MTLFVTGSESFVGRALVARCDELGIVVSGIDSVPNPYQRPGFVVGDIRSPELVDLLPRGSVVVHLAAVSRDSDCRSDPLSALDVNVCGTLNLLAASRKSNARQIVFASSEWVYGDVGNDEIQVEDQQIDITQMTSLYAVSKIVGEQTLRLDDSAIDKTLLRFGIIYGPRLSNWSAVESLFDLVSRGSEVTVGCAATARRFIHVDDIVSGILASVGRSGVEIFNLSGDNLVTLREVVETSASILGREVELCERETEALSIRNPDNAKAARDLSWRPEIGLEVGLQSVHEFLSSA
jgi:nucleoside-diphosphate-sugar epimerase